ncbi:MAG TPA: hypothetical protein VHA80_01735 [Solirubrobacterales bacterium]|nr:hypothetical protein [Solirubrobacterales bacterium]
MKRRKEDVLAWESRWSLPTGLLTFVGVIAGIVSSILLSALNGDNSAALLEKAHEQSSSVFIGSVLNAIGFLLLLAPLYFLFQAAAARSSRVRAQLVGVIIVAPIFFAVSGVLNGLVLSEASTSFVNGEAMPTMTMRKAHEECLEEERNQGSKAFAEKYDAGSDPLKDCEKTEREVDAADNARAEASLTAPATGFELAARIGLAFALGYSCLYAMRVGLLTRFWGSLGMALGVAALLLIPQFTLIFFIYFGLLLIGKLPRGRPPAWAAGEAVPWPTPGERMAKELEPRDGGPEPDEGGEGPVEAPEPGDAPQPGDDGSSSPGGAEPGGAPRRRKRKRRG